MIIEFRQLFDRNLGHGVVENLHMNLVRRNEITLRTSAQPAAMSAALSFDFISATPKRGRSRDELKRRQPNYSKIDVTNVHDHVEYRASRRSPSSRARLAATYPPRPDCCECSLIAFWLLQRRSRRHGPLSWPSCPETSARAALPGAGPVCGHGAGVRRRVRDRISSG